MAQNNPIVIVGFARTPRGNFLGDLEDIKAPMLGSAVISAAVARSQLSLDAVQEVLMGCVLPAGVGQAPARQAALLAGVLPSTPCTTINKVCGSGMKAMMFAHDLLLAKSNDIVVAGGMESMTNAPYLLKQARQGYRFGRSEIYDHMTLDGLEDAYDTGKPMGYFAEQCAQAMHISRESQDQYAMLSFTRARTATDQLAFAHEIIPLTKRTKQGEVTIDSDEHPFSVNPERIPSLPPVFSKDGTVTAGNSSSIADGAAAIVLMRYQDATKRGLTPIARIVGHAGSAKRSDQFTTAPIDAIKLLLEKIQWPIHDVDLFEINEAFAVVVLAAIDALKIPIDKLNIHGGACALGHPIGASGARIVVTLLSALKATGLKRGVASLCIGGGEATAIALEMY